MVDGSTEEKIRGKTDAGVHIITVIIIMQKCYRGYERKPFLVGWVIRICFRNLERVWRIFSTSNSEKTVRSNSFENVALTIQYAQQQRTENGYLAFLVQSERNFAKNIIT